jgi:hypothetical protein
MGPIRFRRLGMGMVAMGTILAAQQAGQDAFLKKARQAYYSLSDERMERFQCTLIPNWKLLLEEAKVAPEALGPAVEKLKAIQFTLTLDRQGAATITHTSVAADNAKQAEGLKQVYSGMEQMVEGFFQTWSTFMVKKPLPEPKAPFHLEELGVWYILTYDEGASKIETTLEKSFAVSTLKAVNKDFQSTISPRFAKTARGLVMVGYQGIYRSASAGEATDLTVAIENQDLDGFTLPKKMDLRGTYGTSPFHVEVAFVGGRAVKY